MLFISRDACMDSIAKLFRACFCGGGGCIAQLSRDVAKRCIAQMCLCETKHQEGGVSHHFGELVTSLKKYREIWVSQR